jgi:hypothetical protein
MLDAIFSGGDEDKVSIIRNQLGDLPENVAIILAQDDSSWIRHQLVARRKLSTKVLQLLAKDEWQVIRNEAQFRLENHNNIDYV